MQNAYISSAFTLSCNGPFSFSSSDYNCLVNDRFDRCPTSLSSPSCCACCVNSVYRVPIHSSFFYGLRQFSLIQWSASRKLMLGSADRCCHRFPAHDIGRSCYCGHVCPLKESRERRFICTVLEEKGRREFSYDACDAEAMLSLLIGEVGDECFGSRERNGRREEVEKRGNYGDNRKKREKGDSDEFELIRIRPKEEDYKKKESRKEEEETYVTGYVTGGTRRRKEGSSCSSYYSCSSLDEFVNDNEDRITEERVVDESSTRFKRESEESEDIAEQAKRHRSDVAEGCIVDIRRGETVGSQASSSGIESDWRKKSDKKLTDVSVVQRESRGKSSQKHVKSTKVLESGYQRSSSSIEQVDDQENRSNLAVHSHEGTRQLYSKESDQIVGQSESRMKYKHSSEMMENRRSDVDKASSSEKCFTNKKESLSAGSSLVMQKDDNRRKSKGVNEVSEIQEINRRTSDLERQYNARVRNEESKSTMNLSWAQSTEKRIVTGQWDSIHAGLRRESLQLAEISATNKYNMEHTSLLRQSDTRVNNQDSNSNLVFGSFTEAQNSNFQADEKTIRRVESTKGTQNVSNISLVQSTNIQVTNINSQEKCSASVVQLAGEVIGRHHQTDEKTLQTEAGREIHRPVKSLSFSEGTSKQASSSQASFLLKSPSKLLQMGTEMEDKQRSEAIMVPLPSQIVPSDNYVIQEVSTVGLDGGSETLPASDELSMSYQRQELCAGATSEEIHGAPLNISSREDTLGSADRLQKSSMNFFDEFVEKVTHEVSTSQIQKEKVLETELVNESQKHQKSLGQQRSGELKSREHDSRHSSRSSRAKGPSDEMSNVTEPSVSKVPGSSTLPASHVARRTGRSLWNIISDLVRIRWSSRSENHNSTTKSAGRSSSNQSTTSMWFSSHELDENNDENIKKEQKSTSPDATSASRGHLVSIPSHTEGGSSSVELEDKDETSLVEGSLLTSSIISESGSVTKTASSVSSEVNAGRIDEGKYESTSGVVVMESSVSVAPLHTGKSLQVDEISASGSTLIATSGSLMHMEQQNSSGLSAVSGSEAKDAELKRRRLQRTNQVLKDRFDEWEEAYKLASQQHEIDEMFMREALLEAKKAADTWEVPVGAVLVQHGKIIARGHNLVEELRDSTAHAEMICIREASNLLRTWRLAETTLYVTLEPCPMCAGAILQARVDTVVWGAPNKLLGADGSWIRLFPSNGECGNGLEPSDKPPAPVHPFHPKITTRRGVLATECADTMQQLFQLRRKKKEKKPELPSAPSCLPISNHPSKFLRRCMKHST